MNIEAIIAQALDMYIIKDEEVEINNVFAFISESGFRDGIKKEMSIKTEVLEEKGRKKCWRIF